MGKETIQDDSTKILIAAITRPISPIRSVIDGAKKRINAEDVRFRLRDWQDQSVVYVPNWIIGDRDSFRLEEAEPELARRVYYDPNEPSRMDCVVGLVARIARIKEEDAKKKTSSELIQKLKEDVNEDEINRQRICFNNVAEEKVFNDFIGRLQKQTNAWLGKAQRWNKYFSYLNDLKGENKSDESFFSDAFGENAPWKNEKDAEKKERLWIQLIEYLKEWKNGDEVKEFLEAVKDTAERYELLHEQWKAYTSQTEMRNCEIAVPVVAFGKFLGVLNFHKEDKFTENDENLARTYAAQLAAACLHRQAEVFEEFQRVARLLAAESNFEVIASKIAEGIRTGLRDGLKREEVVPSLYATKLPIGRFDELTDEEFEKRWEKTYYGRQQPQPEEKDDSALWDKENKLGHIPIRPNGLGRAIIEKWKQREEQIEKKSVTEKGHLFIVSLDVDDPNSEAGSRSALHHNIKTTGCLPLIFKHRVYGLLYLHCTERHFFTEAELHALETSSIQAAIAINNARLTGKSYEELYGKKILDLLIGGKQR